MQDSQSVDQTSKGNISNEVIRTLNNDVSGAFAKLYAVGGYAAVVQDGEITWELPYGKADLASGEAVSRHTLFRIGSITKTFTATGIFQLRDAGSLSLDDSVVKFLPELSDAGEIGEQVDEITLRRLLSHTAGLGRSWAVGRPYITDGRVPDRDEAVASLKSSVLLGPPGQNYAYSNLGFALLGEVITRVSCMDVKEYLVEKICKPLGLDVTRFDAAPVRQGNVAVGYERSHASSDALAVDTLDLKFDDAAGGFYSSGIDLARWIGFHVSDEHPEVLSPGSRREMRHPQHIAPDWSAGHGMNWGGRRIGEVMAFSHSGGMPGFTSRIAIVPEQGFGVIAMLNTKDLQAPFADEIVKKVSEGFASAEAPKKAPEVQIATEPDTALKKFTGIYLLDGAYTVWVEWWRGGLSVRPGEGEDVAEMRAKLAATDDPLVFRLDGAGQFSGMPIQFKEDDAGQVKGILWDVVYLSRVGPIYD